MTITVSTLLCCDTVHRAQFEALCHESTESGSFVAFLNMLINDAVWLLDESLKNLKTIRDEQVCRTFPTQRFYQLSIFRLLHAIPIPIPIPTSIPISNYIFFFLFQRLAIVATSTM